MSFLANRFRDVVSKSKDARMKKETEFGIAYPTGFLSFDFTNGNIVHTKVDDKDFRYYNVGVMDGEMIYVIGRSGSYKTTFVLQCAASIIKPFKTACIFHEDIEGGISDLRKMTITQMDKEEFETKYISRNSGITAENFYERIKIINDIKQTNREEYEYDTGKYDMFGKRIYKLEPTVVILDSLALLIPEQYTEEEQLSGQMSATAAAKMNAAIFKRIIPMLKSSNIILFVINQINEKVEASVFTKSPSQVSYLKQNERLTGGNVPIYLANKMIRLSDSSKLKPTEGFGISGAQIDVNIIKSRNCKAGTSIPFIVDQNIGFDKELSLFLLLKLNNKIGGAGAYLTIGDCPVKFSQKQFKQKLKESEELRIAFMNEIQSLLNSIIESNYTESLNYDDNNFNISNDILKIMNNAA